MQIAFPHSPADNIAAATLDRDGAVHIVANDKSAKLRGTPRNLTKIALVHDGLYAINKRGQLFHWNGVSKNEWHRISTKDRIKDLCVLHDGRLCLITRRGRTLTRDDEKRWQPNDTTQRFLRPLPAKSRWSFGIRGLLIGVTLAAVILGPIRFVRNAWRRQESIERMVASGTTISFEHQVDENGKTTKDAPNPGPKWGRKLLGDLYYAKPVYVYRKTNANQPFLDGLRYLRNVKRLRLYNNHDLEYLRRVPELESLNFTSKSVTDLSPIQDLHNLQKLTFTANAAQSIAPITTLPNLKELLFHAPQATDFETLENLQSLEILTLHSQRIKPQDLNTIAKLKNLRELVYHPRGRKTLHPSLLSSLTKLETLRMKRDPGMKSFDWTNRMTKLRDVCSEEGLMGSRLDILTKDRYQFSPTHLYNWMTGGEKECVMLAYADEPDLATLSQSWDPDSMDHIRLDWARCNDVSVISQFTWPHSLQLSIPHTQIRTLPVIRTPKTYSIDASNSRVEDISNVAGSNIHSLNLAGTNVTNIEDLADCKELKRLNIAGTDVSDLTPLANLKLDTLIVSDSKVASPRGLESLDVTNLQLYSLPLLDSDPIPGMERTNRLSLKRCDDLTQITKRFPNVRFLDLQKTQVSDLSTLPALYNLHTLNLADTPIDSLPDLSSLNELYHLDLSGTKISDVSSVHPHRRLSSINLSRTRVTNIDGLKNGDPQWNSVDLSDTQVADVSGLRVRTSLNLARTPVADVSGIPPIAQNESTAFALDLTGTKVTDISPLTKLQQLRTLSLADTKIDDFSPLTQMTSLNKLDLSGTAFTDLSLLPELGLDRMNGRYAHARDVELNLSRTKVTDIRPLVNLTQLVNLNLAGTKVRNFDPIKKLLPYGLDSLDLQDCQVANLDVIEHLVGLLHLKTNCEHLVSLTPLSNLNMLETLKLQSLRSDHDLAPIANLPFLMELEIDGEVGSVHLLKQLRHIRKLRLPADTQIPDDFVDSLPTLDELIVGDQVIHATNATRWDKDNPEFWGW